jgi:hypothetical protein
MQIKNSIRYVRRSEIDTSKWDLCVMSAPNGWIYARTFYLDSIGDWGALVKGDYEYIMPLPQKRKYGIAYVYIPPFTGQLGIVGSGGVSVELIAEFIGAIPPHFVRVDLLMNEQNPSCTLANVHSERRTNYVIALDEDYASTYSKYTGNAKKTIDRALSAGLSPAWEVPVDLVIDRYRAAYGPKNTHLSGSDYARFKSLADQCLERGYGFTLGIQNAQKEMLAAAFFAQDEKRVYYILGAPTPAGRLANAFHCLIHEAIKMHAGSGMTFDFEGSDIPSVAQFYRKFRPVALHYDLLKLRSVGRWWSWMRS